MPTIKISITDKRATADPAVIVCGNSDYVVEFAFDAEWEQETVRTARFIANGSYQDVVFTGNSCAVPIITDATEVHIGVFAGNLRTTTGVRIPCVRSITCGDGTPAPETEDVYAQLIEMIKSGMLQGPQGDKGDAPEKGVDYWTESDKAEIVQEVMDALPAAEEVSF